MTNPTAVKQTVDMFRLKPYFSIDIFSSILFVIVAIIFSAKHQTSTKTRSFSIDPKFEFTIVFIRSTSWEGKINTIACLIFSFLLYPKMWNVDIWMTMMTIGYNDDAFALLRKIKYCFFFLNYQNKIKPNSEAFCQIHNWMSTENPRDFWRFSHNKHEIDKLWQSTIVIQEKT